MPDEQSTVVENSETGDSSVIESIAISNIKSVAAQPAMLSNLAYSNVVSNVNLSQQNAVSNQQAMNELGLAITGKLVNFISDSSGDETKQAKSNSTEQGGQRSA